MLLIWTIRVTLQGPLSRTSCVDCTQTSRQVLPHSEGRGVSFVPADLGPPGGTEGCLYNHDDFGTGKNSIVCGWPSRM
jgi:hypothetical protein